MVLAIRPLETTNLHTSGARGSTEETVIHSARGQRVAAKTTAGMVLVAIPEGLVAGTRWV